MKKQSFEEMINRLQTINDELESGAVDLESAIALYKEGTALTGELVKKLEAAELEINKLSNELVTEA